MQKNYIKNLILLYALLALFPIGSLQAISDVELQQRIEDSQKAVLSWLQLVDNGQYDQSWDTGAKTFQRTISRNEWVTAMQKLRSPLGKITDRKILDIRWAENPKNLPAGNYMVFAYNSSFQNRNKARELLTLQQGSDGQWRVLTYNIQ